MQYVCIRDCHAPGLDGRRRLYKQGQRLELEAEPCTAHVIPVHQAAVRGLDVVSEEEMKAAVKARLAELGASHHPNTGLARLLQLLEQAEAGEPAIKPQAR